MPTNDTSYLGTYAINDEFPWPYFVFTEKKFDVPTKRFNIVELVPADYTVIKFSARHEDNNTDVDDHANDDIYVNLTSDGNGVYHFVWPVSALNKIGRWTVRIEFERASDAKKFHAEDDLYFIVAHKTSGRFGDP